MHHVDVSGVEAQSRFLDRVGAFGPRVARRAPCAPPSLPCRPTRTSTPLPPQVWSAVRNAMAERGVTQRAMAAMRGHGLRRQRTLRLRALARRRRRLREILDEPALAAVAESDLFWDRVVEIEPAGVEEVFDLTVPGPANWLADGIVTHNSGQIEQDADLVIFIYRDEYYHPETTDRPGEAELIIAKHRNGGLGDVPLTFQNEFPRFLGLQRAA